MSRLSRKIWTKKKNVTPKEKLLLWDSSFFSSNHLQNTLIIHACSKSIIALEYLKYITWEGRITLRVNKKPTRKMNFTNAKVFMIYMLLSVFKPKCRGYYVQLFPHDHSNLEVSNSKRKHTSYNYLLHIYTFAFNFTFPKYCRNWENIQRHKGHYHFKKFANGA